MVAAVGWEFQKPEVAEKLARKAVDESCIGVFEDKWHKIQSKTRGTMRDLVGEKTCGLVREEPEKDSAGSLPAPPQLLLTAAISTCLSAILMP